MLVLTTAFYTRETISIAEATERQAEVIRKQMLLESEPNVILTADHRRDRPAFRLVNLGKLPAWLESVTTTANNAPHGALGEFHERPWAQQVIMPGDTAPVQVFGQTYVDEPDALGNPLSEVPNPARKATVVALFTYGSTGPWLHERTWKIELRDDGHAKVFFTGPLPQAPDFQT